MVEEILSCACNPERIIKLKNKPQAISVNFILLVNLF
jgi:hypothetical protein